MATFAIVLALIAILPPLLYFWVRHSSAAVNCLNISIRHDFPDSGASGDDTQLALLRPACQQPISIESNSRKRNVASVFPLMPIPPLLPEEFVVLDLETTGLDRYTNEIIEFGAIRVNRDSDIHSAFRALVKPQVKIPRLITSITGITQAMVDRDGMPLAKALADFIEFIGELPLVTYNADFDIGFLQEATKLRGHTFRNKYTCALKMARAAWPGLPSYKLSELAKLRNLSVADSHRALGDSKRALVIFVSAAARIGKISWTSQSSQPETGQALGRSSKFDRLLYMEHKVARQGNPAGPLHGEVVVITGECSVSRSDMAVIAATAGCEVQDNVTKRTTIVISGTRDARLYDGKEKSGKLLHAECLIDDGFALRILTELDFLSLVAPEACLHASVVIT